MTIKIKDCDINYIQYGNKKGKNLVLLHGWGQNIEMMKIVADQISDEYFITIIDLPGHGKSDEPTTSYTIYDYYETIKELIEKLKIKNPSILGHSFGGRIGIVYSALESVDKLMLFSAPFIKRITKPSLKVKVLKGLKKVPVVNKLEGFAKKHIGSTDYKNASDMMRKILVNTVNEDLTKYVSQITCSTILIAGALDVDVPLEEMELYEKYLSDSALIVYPNGTHYAYLEDLGKTVGIIRNFIK